MKRILIGLCSTLALALSSEVRDANAQQDAPAAAPAAGGEAGPGTGPNVIVVPGPTTTTTTQQSYPGYLPPAGFDPNGYLPTSSRATGDINGKEDSFDLNQPAGEGGPMHGAATGSYVVEGQFTPDAHTVRRGDTLWEI